MLLKTDTAKKKHNLQQKIILNQILLKITQKIKNFIIINNNNNSSKNNKSNLRNSKVI